MEEKIEDALIEIGVPAGICGFNYIKEAVLILDRDGTDIKMEAIYKEIAKKYGKTYSKVERGIRHAFEVARSGKGDYEAANHYIGYIHINNKSSLSLLYRTIKRELNEENKGGTFSSEIVWDEEKIKKIVRETVKEILGGIA